MATRERQETDHAEGLRKAVAKQNGGDTAPVKDGGLKEWIDKLQPQLTRALPAGGLTADRLARIVLNEVVRTPRLAQCTPASLGGAVMTIAQLGLEPGAATGEAWLVPFKNGRTGRYEVTLIIGYQGMVKLYWQHPLAKGLTAQAVHANDYFEFQEGLNPRLDFRRALTDRGPVIAYFAAATFTTGGSGFVVLSPDDVEEIRARSRAKDDGPWQTDYDAMAKKTCIRQLFKLLPKSTALALALAHDDTVRTDTAPDAINLSPDWGDPLPQRPSAKVPPQRVDDEADAAAEEAAAVAEGAWEPDGQTLAEIEAESAGDPPDEEPRSELFRK